ncbi:MAG: hypothetical protein GY721_12835, partial [Deltaproteobacteria bacterium]|nr:hypothetical protein [Deltaproteobacteria bacterium]
SLPQLARVITISRDQGSPSPDTVPFLCEGAHNHPSHIPCGLEEDTHEFVLKLTIWRLPPFTLDVVVRRT